MHSHKTRLRKRATVTMHCARFLFLVTTLESKQLRFRQARSLIILSGTEQNFSYYQCKNCYWYSNQIYLFIIKTIILSIKTMVMRLWTQKFICKVKFSLFDVSFILSSEQQTLLIYICVGACVNDWNWDKKVFKINLLSRSWGQLLGINNNFFGSLLI